MNAAHLFPALLIALDVGAAVVYGVDGDARRAFLEAKATSETA